MVRLWVDVSELASMQHDSTLNQVNVFLSLVFEVLAFFPPLSFTMLRYCVSARFLTIQNHCRGKLNALTIFKRMSFHKELCLLPILTDFYSLF